MAQGRMPPTMASHSVVVQRLTGDGKGWASINRGESVRPGEPLRLLATGIENQLWVTPLFRVEGVGGVVVFEESAVADTVGDNAGVAWVRLPAPTGPHSYFVSVKAQTFPLTPGFTHLAETTFVSRDTAPLPPATMPEADKPGKDFFANLQGLLIPAIILVGLVVLGPKLAGLIPSRKD